MRGQTGTTLIELISERGPLELPCALVRGHAPFCWAASPAAAVDVAVTLEEVARMALLTTLLDPNAPPLQSALRDKHHERKHGPKAYYLPLSPNGVTASGSHGRRERSEESEDG